MPVTSGRDLGFFFRKKMHFFSPSFFTSWDDSIWTKPTIALFSALFDNYIPAVTQAEDQTPEELAEENAFIDAVMDSAVMTEAYNFLNTKGGLKDQR